MSQKTSLCDKKQAVAICELVAAIDDLICRLTVDKDCRTAKIPIWPIVKSKQLTALGEHQIESVTQAVGKYANWSICGQNGLIETIIATKGAVHIQSIYCFQHTIIGAVWIIQCRQIVYEVTWCSALSAVGIRQNRQRVDRDQVNFQNCAREGKFCCVGEERARSSIIRKAANREEERCPVRANLQAVDRVVLFGPWQSSNNVNHVPAAIIIERCACNGPRIRVQADFAICRNPGVA